MEVFDDQGRSTMKTHYMLMEKKPSYNAKDEICIVDKGTMFVLELTQLLPARPVAAEGLTFFPAPLLVSYRDSSHHRQHQAALKGAQLYPWSESKL